MLKIKLGLGENKMAELITSYGPLRRQFDHLDSPRRERKGDIAAYLGRSIGRAISFSTKYAIPFAVGFYVGYCDNLNVSLDPKTRYVLLTAPTAANMCVASVGSLIKRYVGKVSKNLRIRLELCMRSDSDEIIRRLDELAEISVMKSTARAAVKPSIVTFAGYFTGRLCSRR